MIHQLGVSVRMGYGADGFRYTICLCNRRSQNYFDYNSNAQHKAITDVVTSSSLAHEWVELATNELDGHRQSSSQVATLKMVVTLGSLTVTQPSQPQLLTLPLHQLLISTLTGVGLAIATVTI